MTQNLGSISSAFTLSFTFVILWIPLISPHNFLLSKQKCPSLCVFSSQMLSPTPVFRCSSWFRLFFPLAASPALSPLKLICHLLLHSPGQWDSSEVPCHWCDIWPATQNSPVTTCKPGCFTFCHIYMHRLWDLVSAFLIMALKRFCSCLHCSSEDVGKTKTNDGSRAAPDEPCTAGTLPPSPWSGEQWLRVDDPF